MRSSNRFKALLTPIAESLLTEARAKCYPELPPGSYSATMTLTYVQLLGTELPAKTVLPYRYFLASLGALEGTAPKVQTREKEFCFH